MRFQKSRFLCCKECMFLWFLPQHHEQLVSHRIILVPFYASLWLIDALGMQQLSLLKNPVILKSLYTSLLQRECDQLFILIAKLIGSGIKEERYLLVGPQQRFWEKINWEQETFPGMGLTFWQWLVYERSKGNTLLSDPCPGILLMSVSFSAAVS